MGHTFLKRKNLENYFDFLKIRKFSKITYYHIVSPLNFIPDRYLIYRLDWTIFRLQTLFLKKNVEKTYIGIV